MFRVLLCVVSVCVVSAIVNVHVVPHTHDDVGWLKTVDQYYMGANNSIQHAGVQYILDSVYLALMKNPQRKFTYVEMAFFMRWWNEQDSEVQSNVRQFVKNGQLEFTNGGWCMHDEASTHYMGMIDQTTLGHAHIKMNFGEEAIPKVGWQIDPFGHSNTQASYMTYGFGFSGLVVGRIDYADRQQRTADKTMEFVWRASPSLGPSTQVFTSCDLHGNYGPPDGLCFDLFCDDPPVQDDPRLEDYNVPERVNTFVNDALDYANVTMGNDVIFKFGSDFQYENANEWYKNLDKLIKYVNQDGRVKAFYSTPRMYIESKSNLTWTVKTDDIFPYADNPNSYWTGYFTSRPLLKRYERESLGALQSAKQLVFWSSQDPADTTASLEDGVSTAQHHDGVSGTSKQHVAYDYAKRISKGRDQASSAMSKALSSFIGMNGFLSWCPLLNVSVCPASDVSEGFMVVLYNPLARAREGALIRIPVNHSRWSVMDPIGSTILSSVLTAAVTTATEPDSLPYHLFFLANIPANGWATYFVQEVYTTARSSRPRSPRTSRATVDIENEYLRLTISKTDGTIQSIYNKQDGLSSAFSENYLYYHSFVKDERTKDDQASGAYIFRPTEDPPTAIPFSGANEILEGPVVTEVQRKVSAWIQSTVRLPSNTPYFEIEYNVGPVPIDDDVGKEVIVRYNTDVASGATFYTDSNGREMQQRVLNYRPTWTLNVTQPVAGNYYPVNVCAYLKDSTRQLSVVVDRSQGGASLTSGSLEFMIHRRILHDDSRGVGEPMNETAGITPYPDAKRVGQGINVTGIHRISLGSSSSTASPNANDLWRAIASQAFHDVEIFFGPLPSNIPAFIANNHGIGSLVGDALPPNVDLETLSFHPTETGALLRLGHNFAVGESATYSGSAVVDVKRLLAPRVNVTSMTEQSLSATQLRTPATWITTPTARISMPETLVRHPVAADDFLVTLKPMEIRTFHVQY